MGTPRRSTGKRPLAQLSSSLYEHLPTLLLDLLRRCVPFVLPCRNLGVTVGILRGPAPPDGKPATVLAAGNPQWVGYLPSNFFIGPFHREAVGRVPLWELPRVLKRLAAQADLTIVRLDRLSGRWLFERTHLMVPEFLGTWLDVPEDPERLAHASHSLRMDLRVMRRAHFTYELSRKMEDFEVFYHKMYLPLVLNRYGEHAVIRSVSRVRRHFRRGELLWVCKNGRRIAAGLLQRHGSVLHYMAVGTRNGESAARKMGAMTALYHRAITYAREFGLSRMDFGGVRPVLTDGLVRYKRKWGMRLTTHPGSHYGLFVHWNRLSAPVAAFLAQMPLVFRDRGKLSAVTAVATRKPATVAEAREIHHEIWMPGLHRLYIISDSGWEGRKAVPPGTVLVDSMSAAKENMPKLFAPGRR